MIIAVGFKVSNERAVQFPDQMKTFYKGVSGYLYAVPRSADIKAVDNRECLYYSPKGAEAERAEHIADVYDDLIKYELSGKLKIRRFNEQSAERQNELTELIANAIVMENCFDDKEKSEFYGRYFVKAWERAVEKARENNAVIL